MFIPDICGSGSPIVLLSRTSFCLVVIVVVVVVVVVAVVAVVVII